MAEPRAHEPKLAALHALHEGRLRPAARARLERHLAGCATCCDALLGLQRYARLRDGALAEPTPEIDWARMQPALDQAAAQSARVMRLRRIVPATIVFAAAACASLALLYSGHDVATPPLARAPAQAAKEEPAPAVLFARVTAVAGTVMAVDASRHFERVTLDSRPTEGWTIIADKGSELHLVLPGTGALIVPAVSKLELRTLRPGDVELALALGQVVNHVRKLAAGERYEVIAGDRRVAVRGTHFDVERASDKLAVQVDEGVVAVLASDGSVVTELRAPQRWSEARAGAGAAQRVASHLPNALEQDPGEAHWPVLSIPAWPHVVAWELADADVGAASELQMRLPAGKHEILAHLDDGRRVRGEINLDALGTRFDPRQLRWPNAAEAAPAPRRPPPDANDASAVIHSAEPELQRCYERSMRGQAMSAPNSVRARLRIDIDARGHVSRAELIGDELPAGTLKACVQQVAARWQFPAPGGNGLAFEAPLSFHPAH